MVHQTRTVDLDRVTAWNVGGTRQYVTDAAIRRLVHEALLHHFGLDLPASVDDSADEP